MESMTLFKDCMFAPIQIEFNESHPGFEICENIKSQLWKLQSLERNALIDTLNQIRFELHKISPFKNEPVDYVQWVRNEFVGANDYNPNSVAPPEMELLKVSILSDGYTQPIVTFPENEMITVIDGFHRNRIGKECKEIKDRIYNYLPIVSINSDREDRGDRIAATIRHNRARGKHRIDGMSEIIIELKRRNWSNEKIARELGMDADEILRLSQISGLAEMFADKEFTEAWEVDSINENDNLEINSET
jgi:hypothetical protein